MTATTLFRDMDMRFWMEQAGAGLKSLGHLFIVAHDNLTLYEFLKRKFAGDDQVRVVLDRRRGERRQGGQRPRTEKRQADRRQQRIDRALRARGFAIIPDELNGGDRPGVESPEARGSRPEGSR